MRPSPAVKARVRKVVYARERWARLQDHVQNVEVMMNLNPHNKIPVDDVRVCAGCGPLWLYPATGGIAVLDAVKECEKIAAILLAIHRDLAHVDFPAADKRDLRAGLAAQAEAWTARAQVWGAAAKPNVAAATESIMKHERASVHALARVTTYLGYP
jgi:hypothetical protein